jgi:glycosyltransferase involved in cell wall biosynthesis
MRTFVQESEREWAIGEGADPEATLLIPNRLPHAAVAEAEAIHASRESSTKEPLLVYVGKLDHWPNFLALLRCLDSSWARIKAEFPQARLSAIGRVHDDTARALARYPDVACLGFVPDVTEHLAPARAAILPFYASMGSSLRVLFYALAGLPVVGSPLAFRGFPELEGTVARDDWVGAVGRVLTADEAQLAEEAARLRATALELQRDDGPWDRLAAGVSDLISRET